MTDIKESTKEEIKPLEAKVGEVEKKVPARSEAKVASNSDVKAPVLVDSKKEEVSVKGGSASGEKIDPKKPAFKKKSFGGGKSWGNKGGGKGRRGRDADKEFDQTIVDIARVTRVMAGGKRMRFRACVVIGDRKGRVAFAVAKGADVTLAVNKAVNKAKKDLYTVPIINETIPHAITVKSGAAKLLIKPAPKGTGIIAGGAVRIVFDLAGISNIVAKVLGTNNKINNVTAAIKALKMLKKVEPKINLKKQASVKGGLTLGEKKESKDINSEKK